MPCVGDIAKVNGNAKGAGKARDRAEYNAAKNAYEKIEDSQRIFKNSCRTAKNKA